MKICYVSAFPPSERMLNEYGFHIARTLRDDPAHEVTVIADELPKPAEELPGFNVVRVWRFNDISNPWRVLKAIRKINPDVVWFNLLFATFGNQLNPAAAFIGSFTPALVRAAGYPTHVTLHHLMDHIDLNDAGVRNPRLYRMAGWTATKGLLMANSVTVLLPAYQKTLSEKYGAKNAYFSPHGIFSVQPEAPDMTRRGNPEHRILAMGHWGTYKRLELLMEAFPQIAAKVPNVKLVVAGCDHPMTPGYMQSVADKHCDNPQIEFAGYVAEQKIPELFRCMSLLLMPYSSSTGSSGVAHQAAQHGIPIVCADIHDFREMAAYERLAIEFYPVDDRDAFAQTVANLLNSPDRLANMAMKNYQAALGMTLPNVVQNHLRLFSKSAVGRSSRLADAPAWHSSSDHVSRVAGDGKSAA
jgi:glycosyltransferase involved in cell wall biosynthesis